MIENEIIGQLRLDSPGLRAKEHTAQVPPAERQEREREFSDAALPVLYCSPTMELGVDINALSAVGLRKRAANAGQLLSAGRARRALWRRSRHCRGERLAWQPAGIALRGGCGPRP